MQSYEDAIKEVIEQINYAKRYNAKIYRRDVLLLQPEDYKKIARATKSIIRFMAQFVDDLRAFYEVNFSDNERRWEITYFSRYLVDVKDNFNYDGLRKEELDERD